jgi:hypothetical protein
MKMLDGVYFVVRGAKHTLGDVFTCIKRTSNMTRVISSAKRSWVPYEEWKKQNRTKSSVVGRGVRGNAARSAAIDRVAAEVAKRIQRSPAKPAMNPSKSVTSLVSICLWITGPKRAHTTIQKHTQNGPSNHPSYARSCPW